MRQASDPAESDLQPDGSLRVELKRGVLHGRIDWPKPRSEHIPINLVIDGHEVGTATIEFVEPGAGAFAAPIPPEALQDGVRTIVFRQQSDGGILGRFCLCAGEQLDGDIMVELHALTAELQALKRAFMSEASDRKLRAAERPLIIEESVSAVLRELAARANPPRGRDGQ
ncbi:MAG: hypothetical protein AAGK00_17090 [Pseudomonadota bacterium]